VVDAANVAGTKQTVISNAASAECSERTGRMDAPVRLAMPGYAIGVGLVARSV
jgi:hypothetical protein